MNASPLLQCTDIRKAFPKPDGAELLVLEGMNLELREGQIVGLLGRSGSGKSTLISQFLVEAVLERLGHHIEHDEEDPLEQTAVETLGGEIVAGMEGVKRLVAFAAVDGVTAAQLRDRARQALRTLLDPHMRGAM